MTTATSAETRTLQNLVGGRWITPRSTEHVDVFNPSTGEAIARTPLSTAEDVNDAVQAAAEAFEAWSQEPSPKRAQVMFRYKHLLEAHFDELSRLVTRENGKTLAEAQGDVRRGIEVVEFACGIPHLLKGESLPQVATGIDGATALEPLGVCAGITPFNFPAMVPMWMFPLAIACGNAFILKPSEKTPLTAMRLAELLAEAGLPAGVMNIVHGGRGAVEAICDHPGIAAVSFVGSSAVAKAVYTRSAAAGKRVQAAGGAKNALVVMPDAEPDSTLRAILGAAFGCAGQRCMAGSVLLGVGDAADPLRRRMVEAMSAIRVGRTDDDASSDMGPVIDAAAQDRLRQRIDAGERDGGELVQDGRRGIPDRGFFVGPTLFDHVDPDSSLAGDELFGPVLSMGRPRDLAEAVERVNASGYGNGAVIFTSSGAAAREFARRVKCGMIGVNVGVPAAPALFPFTGWNQSFYGDLHVQGVEGVRFYTRQKLTLSRWDDAYVRTQGW